MPRRPCDTDGEKAQEPKCLVQQDRKIKIKSFMEQLTQILDPKKMHWMVRVAQTIGARCSSGQLLDFLVPM
jgi:hypothetical protein